MNIKSIRTDEFRYDNSKECNKDMALYKENGWSIVSYGATDKDWFFKAQRVVE